jgi:adenosylhomocysteine nucleosidase
MISAGPAGRFIVAAAMDQELAPLKSRALPNLHLLKTGIGVEKATQSLRRCLAQTRVRAVFGIGFAGGLSPELRTGDLVIGRRIRRSSITVSASADLLAVAEKVRLHDTSVHFGTLLTVDQVLGDSASKRSLAISLERHEVGGVDMESSAIAQVCSECQVPFLIVRCITDRLDEDLPIDFNRCQNSDGEMDSKKVLLTALGNPKTLARLWRLRNRSKCCAENLTLFVERLLQELVVD